MSDLNWNQSAAHVAGSTMHLSRAGADRSGQGPVIVLHHDIGTLDRLPFYDLLAADREVLIPHHPGFGRSARPDWVRSVRDIAIMYRELLATLDIRQYSLIGLGFGGWLAAELASMAPREVAALVLVGAMGIKPPENFIFDQAMVDYVQYVRAGFHDQAAFASTYSDVPDTDQLEQWDLCREMCFRIAWKPYMYSQSLPHLLGAVRARALVVWGAQDQIVPLNTADAFSKALGNAPVKLIENCGHYAEMEKPVELTRAIQSALR